MPFAGAGLVGYAFGIEPHVRLKVARYRLTPKSRPAGLRLRMAALADLHACEPWVGVRGIRAIVEATNRLEPMSSFSWATTWPATAG